VKWLTFALFMAVIATALVAGLHWRKLAANVVVPVAAVALYGVWRWRRND
jgi:hypothetical protein